MLSAKCTEDELSLSDGARSELQSNSAIRNNEFNELIEIIRDSKVLI